MATVTTTHISLVLKDGISFFEKLILGYVAMTMLMSVHTKSFLSLLKLTLVSICQVNRLCQQS